MPDNIIEGLHTCKPGNTPSVGQIKSFLVTNETSQRTGNQWTKIANKKPDEGGRWHKVISVRPTDRGPDRNGNISFNLEIEPTEVAPPPPQQQQPHQNTPQSRENGAGRGATPPAQQDTPRQHIMRCANLYALCFGTASTVIRDSIQRRGYEPTVEDVRQIATTLFIEAKDRGYIAHMSEQEQKTKKEPFV